MTHSHDIKINSEKIKGIIKDSAVRRTITKECHLWFFNIYFSHYMKYTTAPFQKELFEITENEKIRNVVIEAFRGSAKTTIMSTSYSIWSILGCQQRKFILILAQTQEQARQYLSAIKIELETNHLLRADLGPFEEPDDEWRSTSIVLPKYGAGITVASIEKSIRGVKHGEHRPDLIICDDLENLESVRTIENRDKVFNWLTGDVIPMGSKSTRLIVIGTRLHDDSIIMRLKKAIAEGKMDGIAKSYPLIDDRGNIAWPGMYPAQVDIEALRQKIPSSVAWEREYMLRIIATEEQIVQKEWIQYYDEVRDEKSDGFSYAATGIDLAISENETSNFTAMVSAKVFGKKDSLRIYILPNSVNERMSSPKTLERAKEVSRSLGGGIPTKLFIEGVGYQSALIQQLRDENYPAEEFQTRGQDKHARLSLTTHLIQSGRILFPKQGAERLIQQLIGFGSERYNDLADAFAILVLKILENDVSRKQYFSEWNQKKHVVDPIPISPHWKLFRAYAHGREKAACCKWYALDEDGRLWVYREFYQAGLNIDQIATEIKRLSKEEVYEYSVADPFIFAQKGYVDKYGGQTIAETFARQEIIFIPGSDRRVDGWNLMHQYLHCPSDDKKPKLVYFSSCIDSMRIIPSLVCSERNPEDLDANGEDSVANCDRLLVTSLHETATKPPLNEVQRKLLRMREKENLPPWDNRRYFRFEN